MNVGKPRATISRFRGCKLPKPIYDAKTYAGQNNYGFWNNLTFPTVPFSWPAIPIVECDPARGDICSAVTLKTTETPAEKKRWAQCDCNSHCFSRYGRWPTWSRGLGLARTWRVFCSLRSLVRETHFLADVPGFTLASGCAHPIIATVFREPQETKSANSGAFLWRYNQLPLNGHLSKRTCGVGPCRTSVIYLISLQGGHLSKADSRSWSRACLP